VKSHLWRWMACEIAALALPLLAFGQEATSLPSVPAREFPVPSTVSPELQRLIAQPIPPLTAMPQTADGCKRLTTGPELEVHK
jgi:hypothetical protein